MIPPSEEYLEALRAIQAFDEERAANRRGPSHPAHPQHDEWLAERGVGREWDPPDAQ